MILSLMSLLACSIQMVSHTLPDTSCWDVTVTCLPTSITSQPRTVLHLFYSSYYYSRTSDEERALLTFASAPAASATVYL